MKTLVDREDLVFNPPDLGCVLYLPGLPGGGSKIYDRGPYGNHGTITGATWKRLPSGIWVLSLDGTDDNVSISDATSIKSFPSGLAIELWVKPGATMTNNGIIHKGLANDDGDYALILGASSHLKVYINGSGSVEGATSITDTTKWYHVAFTWDTVDAKVFVDGAEDNSLAWTTAPPETAGNLTIGYYYSQSYDWQGLVALVRIYNRALSGLEISKHFNQEKHLFGVWFR